MYLATHLRVPYRTKLWRIWRIATIRQIFFANIPDEARGYAVCIVNVRHVSKAPKYCIK